MNKEIQNRTQRHKSSKGTKKKREVIFYSYHKLSKTLWVILNYLNQTVKIKEKMTTLILKSFLIFGHLYTKWAVKLA